MPRSRVGFSGEAPGRSRFSGPSVRPGRLIVRGAGVVCVEAAGPSLGGRAVTGAMGGSTGFGAGVGDIGLAGTGVGIGAATGLGLTAAGRGTETVGVDLARSSRSILRVPSSWRRRSRSPFFELTRSSAWRTSSSRPSRARVASGLAVNRRRMST